MIPCRLTQCVCATKSHGEGTDKEEQFDVVASFGIQFVRNKVMDISFKGKRALVTGAGKGIVKKTPTISEFLMFVSMPVLFTQLFAPRFALFFVLSLIRQYVGVTNRRNS